ncbi:MAG: isocitrate/isopropylmalate dehydrogenase family protein [Bryobacter sp.]|nr:isocitrate/isopropylmalate dehydrogenase family protein [Bryobacter sp.]
MNVKQIALLPGDGIGPDVTFAAVSVLQALGLPFAFTEHPCGAGAFLSQGDPLPAATLAACRAADAILLGAMGIPGIRWPDGREMAPQIDIREELQLYAGIRPIKLYHPRLSPLKQANIDYVLVRESTEGLFSTRLRPRDLNADAVRDEMLVTRAGSERLFHAAFRLAQKRRRHVTLVDKANVLPSMAFFRQVFQEIAATYPDVETSVVYVDACALYLVTHPHRYDVLVTENMFGDILSDLAAATVGGMGLAPSGDIGDQHAVFQPSHGSAPDIAGKGIANPLATILSAGMMCEWLGFPEAHQRIEAAVSHVLSTLDNLSPDLGGTARTEELTAAVISHL